MFVIVLMSLAAILSVIVIQVQYSNRLLQRPHWLIRYVFFEYLSRVLFLHYMVDREEHIVGEERRGEHRDEGEHRKGEHCAKGRLKEKPFEKQYLVEEKQCSDVHKKISQGQKKELQQVRD